MRSLIEKILKILTYVLLSCLPHPCFGGLGWLYTALSGQSSLRHQEAASPISILLHTWVSWSILCQCIRLAVCLRQRCTWACPSSLWATRVGLPSKQFLHKTPLCFSQTLAAEEVAAKISYLFVQTVSEYPVFLDSLGFNTGSKVGKEAGKVQTLTEDAFWYRKMLSE